MRAFVRVLIQDSYLRLLVLNHGAKSEPLWNFPGGKVEVWEGCEEAAIRETREETGLEVHSLRKITTFVADIGGEMWEGHFFFAESVSGMPEIREPTKATEMRYRSLWELYALPALPELLADVGCSSRALAMEIANSCQHFRHPVSKDDSKPD